MANKSKKYEIDIFDVEDIKTFQNELSNLQDILQSKEFMNFLGEKCLEELNRIIDNTLSDNEYIPQMSESKDSNKIYVHKDYVRIYNDSMVDMSNVITCKTY